MIILGIETSCDETGVALVKVNHNFSVSQFPRFSVLSNIVSSQSKIHAKYGGVVPEVAARKHVEVILPILEQAFQQTQISFRDIDLIAVTRGPGLVTSLLVGVETARTLAYVWEKPLVAINHIEAHIYANWLMSLRELKTQNSNFKTFEFPILCLVVSGGHTELVLMQEHGKYKVIGRTRDDAAGECFDKTAKILGLGYPGGPNIAKMAAKIENQKLKIKIVLPRPMIDSPNFDFSFAGLKTAVLYGVRDLLKRYSMEEIAPVIAHEIQEAIVDVLVSKAIRAAKKFGVKTVMLAGGVSANKRLRKQFVAVSKKELPDVKYRMPDSKYCTDNAAMIAVAGFFHALRKDFTPWQKLKVDPNWEL